VTGCDTDHCITCGDDGEAMVVLRVDTKRVLALCAGADGARTTVEIALVEPVSPGDKLLVHAGTAIATLEPDAELGRAGAGAPARPLHVAGAAP
jgi:hydrogenase maturation factor